MTGEIIREIMVPFLGTTLGAASVFFVRKALPRAFQRALTGLAAAVIVAASVWWLIIPSMEQAAGMVTNNAYYMQDAYYTTYIGRKLELQAGKDAALSYAQSPEYEDLRCLLELCRVKGLEVLFVHVPMHGSWNDYTGFSADRRAQYYENVRQIVADYQVELLDLTAYEYEPYFLCDTMHLGWKGWLEVDRAIAAFCENG